MIRPFGHVGDPENQPEAVDVPVFTQAHVDYLRSKYDTTAPKGLVLGFDMAIALVSASAAAFGQTSVVDHIQSLVKK